MNPAYTSQDTKQLMRAVSRLRRMLRLRVRTTFPWEELPMAQVEVMQRLNEEPNLRISDLAAKHHLAKNTVSTLIQRMVLSGLVLREPMPTDRRAVVLNLTPLGAEKLAEWQSVNEAVVEDGLLGLTEQERTLLFDATNAIDKLASYLDLTDAPT